MAQLITYNFHALKYSYKKKGVNGCILEGGSRSRKTWSIIEFIIDYCQNNEGKVVNIIKETFSSFKTTLYNDFKRVFQIYGISSEFEYAKEVKTFNLLGNTIHLLGADKLSKTHGIGSDLFWINEALPISKEFFDQFEQRCRDFWVIDYNPSETVHWIYDNVEPREDVLLFMSTMFDNPYISENEKRKLLSYEPTEENIKQGTADDFMYKVYVKGIRCSPEGLVFKHVTWIDKFPDGVDYWYGLDFGFTVDPTVLTKIAIIGKTIYLECLSYEPMDTPEVIDRYFQAINIEKNKPIIADSSDKYTGENKGTVEMVRDLSDKGYDISKVSKTKSIIYWIGKMKEHSIHIVKNANAKKEQQSYKYRVVNGIRINQPLDKFNHFWDSARYGFIAGYDETIDFKTVDFYNS